MNKRRRADRGPVAVRCQSCGWIDARSTWRPAKRALETHTAQAHGTGVAA